MKNSNNGKKEQNEIILVYQIIVNNTVIRLIGKEFKERSKIDLYTEDNILINTDEYNFNRTGIISIKMVIKEYFKDFGHMFHGCKI